ncbi:MAG: transposase [Acidobacteriota bacterium]|jgi:transposase
MAGAKRDVEKERYWRKTIRAAARSGVSIREFCRRHDLKESQFHWWQRRLRASGETGTQRKPSGESSASFALVSEETGALEAGLELVLADGRRLRIGRGVDEETLRTVLAAVETTGC